MRINRKELIEALENTRKFTGDGFGIGNVHFDTQNQKIVACDLSTWAEVGLEMKEAYCAQQISTNWPEKDFRADLMALKKSQLENLCEYMTIQATGTKAEIVETIIRNSMIAADEEKAGILTETFLVNPDLLLRAVKTLNSEEVEIAGQDYEQENGFLVPRYICVHGYYEGIHTVSPENFPEIVSVLETRQFMCDLFYEELAFLCKVKGDPQIMADYLHHVCFADTEIVSTDGNRLHIVRRKVANLAENEQEKLCIKKKALQKLIPLAKDGVIRVYGDPGRALEFVAGKLKVTMAWNQVQFPDYKGVIDRSNATNTVTVKTEIWKQMLQQANVLTDSDHMGIILTFNSGIAVNAFHPEKGEYKRMFEYANRCKVDPDVTMGLNGSFLKDIPTLQNQLTISFSDNEKPVFIDIDGEKLAVVMPMRI